MNNILILSYFFRFLKSVHLKVLKEQQKMETYINRRYSDKQCLTLL